MQRGKTRTLERMTERTPTILALGFAVLAWCLFAGGWYWSGVHEGSRFYRLLGFTLGGLASVPTVALCIYYMAPRGIRGAGIKMATGISSIYAVLFAIFFGAVLLEHPLATWVYRNAF